MALLTADDILNKKFTATKFREGYDVVEVDDFLDEVLETLRGLQEENEGLKTNLAASEQRVAELSRAGASGQVAPVPEAVPAPEPAATVQEPEPEPEPEPEVVQEPEPEPEAVQEPEPQAAPEPVQQTSHAQAAVQAPATVNSRANEPESATGMLQLAQKLHDDYVRSGQEEGERLVTEAKDEGTRIVSDAQETSDRTLRQLEKERALLERKIDELRQFERDYRTRLQSYLEQLLGDLDNRGAALPDRGGDQSRPGI